MTLRIYKFLIGTDPIYVDGLPYANVSCAVLAGSVEQARELARARFMDLEELNPDMSAEEMAYEKRVLTAWIDAVEPTILGVDEPCVISASRVH